MTERFISRVIQMNEFRCPVVSQFLTEASLLWSVRLFMSGIFLWKLSWRDIFVGTPCKGLSRVVICTLCSTHHLLASALPACKVELFDPNT